MKKKADKLVRDLNIGGLPFKVYYVKKFPKKIVEELGENCVAYCDFANRTIWLEYPIARIDDLTLVHEIMHAAIESVTDSPVYQKEWFVKAISQLLYGALKSMGRPLH